MPYSDILKRSFDVLRREPALWVLGFIFALFGGGGNTPSFNWNTSNFGENDIRWERAAAEMPAWLTPENIGAIVAVIIIVILALMFLGLLVQSVALAGLIHGADRAATGEDVHWGQLWRIGFSREGRRVFGLRLLLGLPVLAGVLIAMGTVAIVGIPLFRTVAAGNEPGSALIGAFIGTFFLLIPVILILIVVSWVLNLLGNYAARAVVLDHIPVTRAIGHGWQLFKGNAVSTIVMAILLGVIGFLASVVIGFALLFAVAVIGVPLFFLLMSQGFPLVLTIVSVVLFGLVVGLFGAALQGPLLAYSETVWTLTWRHLTGALPSTEVELTPATV